MADPSPAPAPIGAVSSNRTDLTAPKPDHSPAFTGMPYGQNKALNQMAQNIPTPGQAPVPAGPSGAPQAPQQGGGGPSEFGPPPGAAGDFLRPTERPNEPVTHGLSTGPGAGPEIFGTPPNQTNDNVLNQLRAIYAKFPLQSIADLLTTPTTENPRL